MDSGNKVAIIVAVIGALATIISACIGVSLRRENVVLVNDNTAMQSTISALESRLSQLEQAKGDSVDNTEEIARLKSDNEKLTATVEALQDALNNQPTTPPDSGNNKTDTAEKRDLSQSVGVHTLFTQRTPSGQNIGYYFKDYGVVTDNRGNTHEHSINSTDWNYGNAFWYSFSVNLDYQYKELSGVLFQNGYYSASPANTTLTIKNNSTLLWEGKVNGNSDAVTFKVDVTGMQYIVFEIDNANTSDQPPAFFEAYLWK